MDRHVSTASDQNATLGGAKSSDKLDPSKAHAGVARWRRTLADAAGGDLGSALDAPRNRLTMLKIFGSTNRLAEMCLKAPLASAEALIEGPSVVIAQAARDLSNLAGGIGGADALHGALQPIKARVDLSIAIAELGGVWSHEQGSSARTEFAERLVETSVTWLLRAGVNRGELSIDFKDGFPKGVFALAGGDFAHEDLTPFGPLGIAILYDPANHKGQAASLAERAFIRLGAEFREVFEGKPGDHPLFSLTVPLGSGVQGAGLVESLPRANATLQNEQDMTFRKFLATARVVAGDRSAAGKFLEEAEEVVWETELISHVEAQKSVGSESQSPQNTYATLTEILRFGLGKSRPVFRTAPSRDIIEKAADQGLLPKSISSRLVSGLELVQAVAVKTQFIKGNATQPVKSDAEEAALASLCGYTNYNDMKMVVQGTVAEVVNALPILIVGPRAEVDRYRPSDENPDDVDKLKDLGFSDGEYLTRLVDGWTGIGTYSKEQRFSAIAPGLLTDFGQSQHPDKAISLFDHLMGAEGFAKNLHLLENENNIVRNTIVDSLGCFGAAVDPLVKSDLGVEEFVSIGGDETPQNGEEWINRFPCPKQSTSLDMLVDWRRENIARIAKCVSSGEVSFGTASEALSRVHDVTLGRLFDHICGSQPEITLHLFETPMRGLPGAKTLIGTMVAGEASCEAENLVKEFIEALHNFDRGFFAFAPGITHRPGGSSGVLAPTISTFKSYIHSEAIAHDQILLARARVIAGSDDAIAKASDALRSAISNPKRADILFRDIDRARAQTLRRNRATSEWDVERTDGGLSDVELIISTLLYRHAAAMPAIQVQSIEEALSTLSRSGMISNEIATSLISARSFWRRIATVRALASWSDPQMQPVRSRFSKLLARAAEVEKFEQIKPLIHGYSGEIVRLYSQLVLGRPSIGLVSNG